MENINSYNLFPHIPIDRPLIVGTRGSPLALIQTRQVISMLTPYVETGVKERVIHTTPDKILTDSLSSLSMSSESKGVFVKELEEALLDGRIDLAVHSLKDLPVKQPPELIIAAIPSREDPRDSLITKNGLTLNELPAGTRIGTGSLRRKTQLMHIRPDLVFIDIRGNLGTRLKKLENGECDALILAKAGLTRLGYKAATYTIPYEIMLPACGQGALAIECKKNSILAAWLSNYLDNTGIRFIVTAERAFLAALEGGCQLPIGGSASLEKTDSQKTILTLTGVLASLDGKHLIRDTETGHTYEAQQIGERLAQRILKNGGNTILRK